MDAFHYTFKVSISLPEFSGSGQKLTWDEMREVVEQAIIRGGINPSRVNVHRARKPRSQRERKDTP